MPWTSEEERKKQQERGKQYVEVTGQQVAEVEQRQRRIQQSRQPRRQIKQQKQELPFMAVGTSPEGEPVYTNEQSFGGSFGFKEWARKTFSKVFDPSVSSPFLSEEQKAVVPQLQKNIQYGLQNVLKWDEWIGKVTGITSEEAAQATAPLAAETDPGDLVANFFSGSKRAIGQGFWTGLNLLGGLDYVQRRVTAFSKTVDEIADTNSVLPDTPHYGDFRDYIIDSNPITWAYNAARVVTSPLYGTEEGGQLARDMFVRNLNSSKAIYSLYWDGSKREEYIRRYEAGENPIILQLELENPWVELGGSIFLDPTTYFGLGYISKFGKVDDLAKPARFFGLKLPWEIKHLPTFGEALGLTIGKGRVANEAARAFDYATPEMGRALKRLQDVPDDARAIDVIKNVVSSVRRGIEEVRSPGGGKNLVGKIFSWSSSAKANLFSKDVGQAFNTILASNPNSLELVDEILPAMYKLVRGTDTEIADAISTLGNSRVPLEAVLSERGIKASEGIARLLDGGLIDNILSKENDVAKMGDEILNAVSKLAEDLYPSIDEMEKAADLVKAGKKVTERGQQLSDYYDAVPDYVKTIRSVTKKYEKAWRPIAGGMANIYIRLNPAFTPRNILGQGIMLLTDLGASDAAAISARSAAAYSSKITESLLAKNADEMLEIAGAIPKRFGAGFGGTDIIKAGTASRSEAIASSEVMLRVARDTIENAMRQGVFPGVEALTKAGMVEDDAKLLLGLLKKNYGSTEKSWAQFTKIIADGTIDTFRTIDPPQKVQKMLKDSKLWGKFEDLRAGAQSADEFSQGLAKLKDEYRTAASRVVNDPQGLSSEIPQVLQEVAQDIGKLADDGEIGSETADIFTRMVQGWRNARASNDQLVVRITQDLHLAAQKTVGPEQAAVMANQFTERFGQTRSAYDTIYGGVDSVRKHVRKLVDLLDKNAPLKEVVAQAKVPKNITETLWELTGDYVSRQDLRKALWDSYFDFSRAAWREANETLIGGNMKILEDYAAQVGVKLEDMAKSGNYGDLLSKSDKDWRIANDLDSLFMRINGVPEGTLLGQMDFKSTSKFLEEMGWSRGNTKGLLNAVNKDRRAAGLLEYKRWQDVPYEEAITSVGARNEEYTTLRKSLENVSTPREEIPALQKGMQEIDNMARPATSVESPVLDININEAQRAKQVEEFKRTTDVSGIKQKAANVKEARKIATESGRPYSEVLKEVEARMLAPHAEEGGMSMARVLYENMDGFFSDLNKYGDEVIGKWGETKPISSKITPELEKAWTRWAKEADKRMGLVRGKALTFAEGMRDFILHDYNKTYADLAIAYLSPFHYWTNRTYMRFIERVLEKPSIAANYLKYRQFMEREHAGLPEWWKYNIQLKGLPGMGDTPLMFNLEATINPMNGLTGVDFEDSYKRVDWLSSMVDDMQKFGPTLMTPVNWAVALHLYQKGEDDAARRWMGRLIPQTQAIKAGLSLVNVRLPETPFSRHNELDPFVNFLMDGVDPYEERRVGRALGGMVLDGTVSQEQAIDSSLFKNDRVWDAAIERAIDERAPGQLFSFFAGVGFKPRTEGDIAVDKFYNEFFQLISMRENMSSLDYSNAMSSLGEKYPFMDTVLISRKGGNERDSAYVYNTFSRVPPGRADDIMRSLQIEDLRQRFYEDKGDMSGWKEQDRSRLMDAAVDIGAMFQIPDNATKQEWNAVKDANGAMYDYFDEVFGNDIQEKVQTYYGIRDENRDNGKLYLEVHPEVSEYLDAKSNYVTQNPLLFQYYGSLQTVENYYQSKLREELKQKYGPDIYELAGEYSSLPESLTDQRKAWREANPEMSDKLFAYFDDLDTLKSKMQKRFGSDITDLASQYSQIPKDRRSNWRSKHKKAYKRLQKYWDVYYDERDKVAAKYGGEQIQTIADLYSSLPKEEGGPRKQWQEEHPDEFERLTGYWEDAYNEQTQRNVNDATVRLYNRLPQAPEPLLRGEPETTVQQTIAEQAVRQQVSAQELVSEMPQPLIELLDMYYQGDSLPQLAIDELERIADRYDLSVNDVLLIIQSEAVQ